MRQRILDQLAAITNRHDVRILYAVESGSRGWGFASPDSDYDVRFVYLHRTDWYLSVDEKKDCIELPVDPVLDINGWDAKKALLLYKKSNPTLLEWLSSPVVYIEDGSFAGSLRAMLPDYFSVVHAMHHYFHTARNTHKETIGKPTIKLKKYFYMLRPLLACAWIGERHTCPPMEFSHLLESAMIDGQVREEIARLTERKRDALESQEEPVNAVLMGFIEVRLSEYEQTLNTMKPEPHDGYDRLSGLFRSSLNEYWMERK